jgi:hypothetical protein
MRIRDGDSSDPGWKKVGSGIRDKHPGSAYSFDTDPDQKFFIDVAKQEKITSAVAGTYLLKHNMVSFGLLGTVTVIAVEVRVHGSRRFRVHPVLRIRDVYPESRTKFFHPGSEFSIQDQGQKRFRIPAPHHRIIVFLTQKSVSKLLEKCSEMFIPDPDPDFFPFRIQGSKRNPNSGSATYVHLYAN